MTDAARFRPVSGGNPYAGSGRRDRPAHPGYDMEGVPKMPRHPSLQTLTAYYDGDLGSEPAEEVTRHLARCHRCGQRYHLLWTIEAALAPHRDPPAKSLRRLINRLGESKPRGGASRR